ncbi:MAG: fibronectin type III domain-containing protein [Verrucomicrobiota bacterium]
MNPTLLRSFVSAWKPTLFLALLVTLLLPAALVRAQSAIQGFGGLATGGQGGTVRYVTSLSDDNPGSPASGTLRWAINQARPSIIKFQVAGTIVLKDRLTINGSNLTIDGSDAPGDGICLRDYSVDIKNATNIVVRYIRIRRGDVALLAYLDANEMERYNTSAGLDCVSIDDSQTVLFDHCSVSWSCDELFGIVRSRNVTIQWCILSEPLGYYRLHPYGDNHAYGMNISASTVSIHHSLFAHYVMRGPQFEANDMANNAGYNVQLEAVNNLIFDYSSSGSRYSGSVETSPSNPSNVLFQYHFVNNKYINPNTSDPTIEVITKHTYTSAAKAYVNGNLSPHRTSSSQGQWVGVFLDDSAMTPITSAATQWQNQMSNVPLFTSTVPITTQAADAIFDLVLDNAGVSHARDAADARIVNDVRNNNYTGRIESQADVGGWPTLNPGPVAPVAPSNLQLNPVSTSQINLSWNDNAGNETAQKIQRSTNGTSWSDLITVGANVTTHPDTGLSADTRYYYRVNASNTHGTSAYSNVADVKTLAPNSLPSPWVSIDIGSVGIAGSATHSSGTFTLVGSGDLKGGEDRFRYMYQVATGDCEIKARVTSVQNNDSDAAAGVMIRDDLNDDCKEAAMLLTASNGAKARRRTSVGGNTIDTSIAVSAPEWVRVKREGDSFKFYRGGDGTNWTLEKTVSISMGSTVRIGLAVTSDDNSETCTATFTNVTATP